MLRQRLNQALQNIINRAGTPIRVQYFSSTIGSVYDDDVTWSKSGNDLWTSGVVLPLNSSRNSTDSILLEQGKIINDDKKIFVHGSLVFTGSEMLVSIRIGSPGNNKDNQFTLLSFSQRYDVQDTPIYKQVYIRQIGGTGSLLGQ